jgi:flagellar motor switch protein FliM
MDKILSQEEIDALLTGMTDGQVDTKPEVKEAAGIKSYDLTNQDRIIRGRMPTLEVINDNFARLFRNSLTVSLRKVVEVAPKGVRMIKFGEFIRTLPVPTSLHIFKMEPLRGHAILVLDSKLIFTLVDLFLGGSGKTNFRVEGREFTAIEYKLIRKVANMFYTDWEKSWNSVHPISIHHVRTEGNPQFVGIVPPSDIVVTTPFGVEFDQFSGAISVCIPYSVVEPIKNKLNSGFQSENLEVDHTWIERFAARLHSAEVEIVVELGNRTIMVQELLNLKTGDVLTLDKDIRDSLVARVEGVSKFLGRAGVCGESKAFQIEARITP